jgi:hypothetical protein
MKFGFALKYCGLSLIENPFKNYGVNLTNRAEIFKVADEVFYNF